MQDLRDLKVDQEARADLSDLRDIKAIKLIKADLSGLRVDKAVPIIIQALIIRVEARAAIMAQGLQAPDTKAIIQGLIMNAKVVALFVHRDRAARDKDRDIDRQVQDIKVETDLPVDIIKDQDPEDLTGHTHQDPEVPVVLVKDRDTDRQADLDKARDLAVADITKDRDRLVDIRDRLREAVLITSAAKRM
jgi:hypothetical protein